MPERYLHEFDTMDDDPHHQERRQGLTNLTAYPAPEGSELPPEPIWYLRWLRRIWHTVPCMLMGSLVGIVFGVLACLGQQDLSYIGLGAFAGAIVGINGDLHSVLSGRMYED